METQLGQKAYIRQQGFPFIFDSRGIVFYLINVYRSFNMYRTFKNLDIDLFISDTRSSSLNSDPPNELDDLVALHDSELSGIFNRHVPIKKRTVTIRPAAPWYSEELKSEKREKRRLERRWRASRSMRDREAYTRQCKVLKDLLSSSRSNYYSNLVAENQSNMRSLFAVFSKLLHRRLELPKA